MRRTMYVPVGSALHERKRIYTFSSPGSCDTHPYPCCFCVSSGNKGLTREWPATCDPSSGQWDGNPAVRVTVLDCFNDLLLQRLSARHKLLRSAFRRAAGRNRIPDYGVWLTHRTLRSVLPKVAPTFKPVHDLRVRAELAHATPSDLRVPSRIGKKQGCFKS